MQNDESNGKQRISVSREALQSELNQLRLEFIKQFPDKEEFQDLKNDIREIKKAQLSREILKAMVDEQIRTQLATVSTSIWTSRGRWIAVMMAFIAFLTLMLNVWAAAGR